MTNLQSDSLLKQRLDDMIRCCVEKYTPSFTKFLDGAELMFAKQYTNSFKEEVIAVCYGGFEESERCVVGLFPKSIYGYEGQDKQELLELFELSFVKIQGSGYKKLSHRDFLGSVLGLGVKREAVGDIYVCDDEHTAYAVFTKAVGEYICGELSFVGSDKVKITAINSDELPVPKREFIRIIGTVAAFRIDCILALCINSSREKAKKLIDSKCVSVNHTEQTRCDLIINEGDLLSVRGFGRFKVVTLGDVTKKGRNRIEIHKAV